MEYKTLAIKNKEKYKVKVEIDPFDNSHQFAITTNGWSWATQPIDKEKAKLIIECLNEYINNK